MGKDVWLNFALEEVLTGVVLDLTLDLLFNLDLICAALPCTGRGLAGLELPFLPVGALVAFLRFDRAGAWGVLFLTLACDFFVAMALQTYSTCNNHLQAIERYPFDNCGNHKCGQINIYKLPCIVNR